MLILQRDARMGESGAILLLSSGAKAVRANFSGMEAHIFRVQRARACGVADVALGV